MFNHQRFTALHLALVAILTLFIAAAIFRSQPTDSRADPTTTAITNLIPKTATAPADTLPTLPVYLRDGAQGLIPEAESELELTLQWRIRRESMERNTWWGVVVGRSDYAARKRDVDNCTHVVTRSSSCCAHHRRKTWN